MPTEKKATEMFSLKVWLEKKIIEKKFNFLPPAPFRGTDIVNPHVIVGTEAFNIHTNVMRPFPREQALTDKRRAVYNYHLYRARQTSEKAFGILLSYFRIFQMPISENTEIIDSIVVVLVACVLHNMMIQEQIPAPQQNTIGDIEGIIQLAINLVSLSSNDD